MKDRTCSTTDLSSCEIDDHHLLHADMVERGRVTCTER